MGEFFKRWLPRLLTSDEKRFRVTTSEPNLGYFERNTIEFLRRFVTMDETWIYHSTPESREGSKQWVKPRESVPKRPKTQQSASKVMTSVFCNAHGIIFIDYHEKGWMITGAHDTDKKHELGFE